MLLKGILEEIWNESAGFSQARFTQQVISQAPSGCCCFYPVCSFLCLPLRLKCHWESGWCYFLSCYNLQETKQMVNLSLWLLCFMGDLVWKMTEPHTGTLIEGKRGVDNIHKAFMSQENCDHRFTRHGTSWWVTLHPVVDRHFVSAVLSELKLLWSWLGPWETPFGSGVWKQSFFFSSPVRILYSITVFFIYLNMESGHCVLSALPLLLCSCFVSVTPKSACTRVLWFWLCRQLEKSKYSTPSFIHRSRCCQLSSIY